VTVTVGDRESGMNSKSVSFASWSHFMVQDQEKTATMLHSHANTLALLEHSQSSDKEGLVPLKRVPSASIDWW
jgi:hypothetical protein